MKAAVSESDAFIKVDNIDIPEIFSRRFRTNIEYLDRAFSSDGWVPGSTFTISGTPGSGKTTLLCQLLQQLALNGKNVAYISGEESIYQLAYNCRRIGATDVSVANITDLKKAMQSIKDNNFDFVVLDSIPCFTMSGMYYNKQEREQAAVECILQAAHSNECVIGCVLHVTKTGSYKGSTLLPHSVDACFHLKRDDEDLDVRILENTKNRFGCAVETPLKMTSEGFSFEPVEATPSEETVSRVSILTVRSDNIVKFIEDHITINMLQAMTLCDNNRQNAYLAIRNCVNSGLIRKEGRGDDAKWLKI